MTAPSEFQRGAEAMRWCHYEAAARMRIIDARAALNREDKP